MRKKQKKWITCLLWLLGAFVCGPNILAQDSLSIWKIDKVIWEGWPKNISYKHFKRSLKEVRNKDQIDSLLVPLTEKLAASGWLEAKLVDYQYDNGRLLLKLNKGPQYLLKEVHIANYSSVNETKFSWQRSSKTLEPLYWPRIEKELNDQLNFPKNNGYPFASFILEDIHYEPTNQHTVETTVHYSYQPDEFVVIDSIFFEGAPKEKPAFIYTLMGIRPQSPYNRQLILNVSRILNNSIYYENTKTPSVKYLKNGKAHLTVELESGRAGKFDALLGFLQSDASSSSQTNNSRRLQIIGSAEVVLVSSLKMGDVLKLSYQKLTSTSQQLNIFAQWPYMLNTPIHVEGYFDIRNQEEQFLVREFKVGGKYTLSPNLAVSFYLRDRNSRLLDSAFQSVNASDNLNLIGGQLTLAGIGFSYNNLDYPLNPTKGISLLVEAGTGSRETRRNRLVDDIVFDSLEQEQPSREIRGHLRWFQPLSSRQVVHFAHEAFWLGQETYFQNDQLQVGGAKSIRGFNENQFFTDLMLKFTAEYRFLLERNSYLSLFGDYAYLRDRVSSTALYPRGFGIGMHYGTKAGIISISYAAGKVGDFPFEPARGKIHIGFVNQF